MIATAVVIFNGFFPGGMKLQHLKGGVAFLEEKRSGSQSDTELSDRGAAAAYANKELWGYFHRGNRGKGRSAQDDVLPPFPFKG